MTNLDLDIDTCKLAVCTSSPLPRCTKVAKDMILLTYSLSNNVIHELNELARRGCKITVVAAKLTHGASREDCKFRYICNKLMHAKVWIIDNHVFVGSANLTGDTIINLTVEVKDIYQRRAIAAYAMGLALGARTKIKNKVF